MPLQTKAVAAPCRTAMFEAVGFVAVAALLTTLIHPFFAATMFTFFHAAVALAAWRGGWRSGVFAIVLSVAAVDFFFLEPYFSFRFSPAHIPSFLVFAGVSLFISHIVTLQRDTSRVLAQQRVTTQNILENINDMFFAIDSQWRLTYFNERARTYHPEPMDNALGAHFWDVFSRHKGTETEERFRRVMETRQSETWETMGRYSDNYFKTSVFPTNEGGLSVFVTDISEQKQAQLAEIDAKERLKIALSAGNIGTWQWNAESDRLDMSPRAFDFFGFEDSDDRSFAALQTRIHPDDLERIKNEVATAVEDSLEHNFEYRIFLPDGSLRCLIARGQRVSADAEHETHLVGVVQDITERKNVAETLAQGAQQLKLALDAAKAGTWEWDLASGETLWSDELYSVFGLDRDQQPPSQEMWAELVHPDDRAQLTADFERAVAQRSDLDLEHRIVHNGRTRWINSRGRCFFDENDQLTRTAGIIVDVTERKEREAERRVLEQRFQTMADSAPVLIWIADSSKNCTWFNRPWLEWTGRTQAQECGYGWAQSIHPDERERVLQIYNSSIDARQSFTMEYRLLHHSGEYRWLLNNGRPLFSGGGEFSGFIGSCVDIEAIKQAEAERNVLLANERTARSEAERVSRMKDEFLATLSHELRTPLNAVLGWSNLLRTGAIVGEEAVQGLEVIERNARLQAQLIEDLLDMSRIISGKLRLEMERVELSAVIQSSLASILPAADAREIQLIRVLDAQAGLVMGDPNRLQQIIWNLLSNAVKFTPKGGRVEVVLRRADADSEDAHIEIVVSDSGDGIAPAFLPHVFDRFRQADSSSTRSYGGLGLGLGIVRNLVELHGGTVSAHSEGLGRGATFTVSLPLAPPRAEIAEPRARHAFLENSCPPAMAGLRVLVVDDEPDARHLVQRILESCNVDVTTVGTAQEAFQYIRDYRPDVLVSDIGMPEEDGYSLIGRVRALPENQGGAIRAVALTALARAEDRRRALLSGFQMHVSKPVDPPELIAVVANVAGLLGAPLPETDLDAKRSEVEA